MLHSHSESVYYALDTLDGSAWMSMKINGGVENMMYFTNFHARIKCNIHVFRFLNADLTGSNKNIRDEKERRKLLLVI